MTDVKVTVDMEDAARHAREPNLSQGRVRSIRGRPGRAGRPLSQRRRRQGKLSGKIGDDEKTFDFPARFVDKSDDDTNSFVAKLWATRRVGDIIDELDLKGRNEELVNELVALATEHGILTPYTSFLADETSDVRDVAGNRGRAFEAADALSVSSGQFGFAQRGEKLSLQTASQAPAAAAADASSFRGSESEAKSLRMAGGGFFGGNVAYCDAAGDRDVAVLNCRQIGRKTFFDATSGWSTPQSPTNKRKRPARSSATAANTSTSSSSTASTSPDIWPLTSRS